MNTIKVKLKESTILRLIDLYVIIVQISFQITIVSYFIFDGFEPFNLVLLLNAFICIILYFIRFKQRMIFPKGILLYPPILVFFILLFFQLLSGINKMELDYIGVGIVYAINFIFFIIYLQQLFLAKCSLTNDINQSFFKFISYYIYFGIFNVLIVIISAVSLSFNLISKNSNSIDDLFPNLFSNNVLSGTEYFMPGWMSITTQYSRLFSDFGTFTGWTHEPHVFCYLVFPTLFLILAKYHYNKRMKVIILCFYLIAFLLSFSVTSLIVLICILLFYLLIKKKFFTSIIMVALLIICSSYLIENIAINNILSFTTDRLIDDKRSLSASSAGISSILIPETIFGDGVLLATKETIKNAGFFAAIFYVIFYLSIFISILKISIRKEPKNIYIAMAFLYFTLHSFKLSASVFAMPYTIYILTIMAIYEIYISKYKMKI